VPIIITNNNILLGLCGMVQECSHRSEILCLSLIAMNNSLAELNRWFGDWALRNGYGIIVVVSEIVSYLSSCWLLNPLSTKICL